jgi:N-hydroxyarylamine O-acetyltransferase
MENGLDLDAYFDRIQWGGSTRPTYETLAGVLRAHMSSIPFENLDVLLGRPIRLDLDGLQRKLVRARRGGYCFEHGTLFGAVIEAIGFRPVRHTACVIMFTPRAAAPRTHMFLTVPVAEGTFVVDPGFGALAPRIPVPLLDSVEARIGPEAHWMARDGPHWILRSRTAGKESDCWLSTLEEDNPVDFEVGSHYVATHPGSPFVNRMMMRALTADGRVTVANRDVNIRCGDMVEPVQLVDRSALRTLLITYFGFDLPEVEHMTVPSIPEWR